MKNLFAVLCTILSIHAFAQVTFTGATSATSVANNAPAIVIDNSLVITTSLSLDGARASVSTNFATGDLLGYDATSLPGTVTGSYNSTSGVLTFTGTATAAQYQTLLRTVTFNTTAASTSQRTVLFNLGTAIGYSTNNHFYEFIAGSNTWAAAKTAAAAKTLFGMQGYLATVTSQGENDFIQQKLTGDGWIGASDDYSYINAATGATTYANQTGSEGKWYWVTGPAGEIGTQFSNSNSSPTSVSSRYMNWNPGEPNNSGSSENSGEIYSSTGTGKWNDLNGTTSSLGYVVEYGGMSGDPVVDLTDSRNIVMIATQLQTTASSASYALKAAATFVDQNVIMYSNGNITNMSVTISGYFQTGDVLSYTGSLPSGVTAGTYNSTTGVLSFTGTTSAANWQALMRTVKFNSSSMAIGNRTVTFSAGNQVAFTNGHFYEYVSTTAAWATAKTNAAAKTYMGLNGYLATVTSSAENDFIRQKLSADAWIGASDDYSYINAATGATTYSNQTTSEGNWYWVTGPVGEIGTKFSVGNSSPVAAGGNYMNWNAGEPNNSSSNENYGEFYSTGASPGQWNDLSGTGPLGFVVEYGGLASDPLVYLSANRVMSINSILPVTNLNFTVTKKVNTAELNWSTETENNSDRFDVMWSTNAVQFTKIGTLTAAGTSSARKYYKFTHEHPMIGDNFYRLQQVDLDGKSAMSDTRYFHIDGSIVNLSPNPASSVIVINSEVTAEPKELQIIDLSGKVVLKTKLLQGRQSISISSLTNGIYIAEILADKVGIKFIKN
jgi:Secretion system C-terminal sorting domain/Lectin C-type domain